MSGSVPNPSVWSLPWHTLRLAGRCILPLILWFTGGEIARYGLLVAASEVSHGELPQVRYAVATLLFVLVVMVWIVVTVGMFHSVRGALMEIRARGAAGHGDERFSEALFRAAIPFVVLYLAWGWHEDDVRDFTQRDIHRQSGEYGYVGAWSDAAATEGGTPGEALTGLNFVNSAILMAVALVLRFLFVWWYENKGSRAAVLGAVFAELAVFYYGIEVLFSQGEWVGDRAVTVWFGSARDALAENLPAWGGFWEVVGEYQPFAWDALVLPAVWLTVAVLVYGAYAEDTRSVITGTGIEDQAIRVQRAVEGRTHSSTRRMLGRFFGRWAHWVPIVNTFRLTVRGGAPLFGLFALCFVAIQVGEGYARRGLVYLVGADRPTLEWNVWFVPIGFVVDLVTIVLTVCLLAATFDLAATRGRASRALSGRNAAPTRSLAVPSATESARPERRPSPVPR